MVSLSVCGFRAPEIYQGGDRAVDAGAGEELLPRVVVSFQGLGVALESIQWVPVPSEVLALVDGDGLA